MYGFLGHNSLELIVSRRGTRIQIKLSFPNSPCYNSGMLPRHIDIIETARFTGQLRKTKRVRLSRRFRQRIYWRDSGKCSYCGNPVPFKDVTLDHITPLTKRGQSRSKENLTVSCKPCNRAKGPLELQSLDDLSPEALCVKFQRVVETTAKRQGHFRESACVY